LSLPPGRYFVRVRAPEVLYEGSIDARPGGVATIDTDDMSRIDYARLVRKGSHDKTLVHGPELGAAVRTALPNSSSLCWGAIVGYGVELSSFGVRARLGGCFTDLQAAGPEATVNAYDAALMLHYAWDVGSVALLTGLGLGLSIFEQRFNTIENAPDRLSMTPFVSLNLAARVSIAHGWYAGLEAEGQTHFLRIIEPAELSDSLVVGFAVRTSMAVGKHF
jgi:hypothetical protein